MPKTAHSILRDCPDCYVTGRPFHAVGSLPVPRRRARSPESSTCAAASEGHRRTGTPVEPSRPGDQGPIRRGRAVLDELHPTGPRPLPACRAQERLLGSCLVLRSIPETAQAMAIRDELRAARDAPGKQQVQLLPLRRSADLEIARSGYFRRDCPRERSTGGWIRADHRAVPRAPCWCPGPPAGTSLPPIRTGIRPPRICYDDHGGNRRRGEERDDR